MFIKKKIIHIFNFVNTKSPPKTKILNIRIKQNKTYNNNKVNILFGLTNKQFSIKHKETVS